VTVQSLFNMADVSKADKGKERVAKPEKPDEDAYKKDLEAAEKAHESAKARFVSTLPQLL
jgi:hypothetical protein